MKALLLAIALLSTSANAAWYAEAYSSSAYGWGESLNRQAAIHIAMGNCRNLTPYWDTCSITTIYWR